jgi:hypothetical protein
MKRIALLAAAAALASGPALSQAVGVDLTPQQETTIYSTLHAGATVGAAPADVTIAVGQPLPEAVELRPVPQTVKVESIRQYRYAVVGPQVVLVEPQSRKVVRVIKKR